MQIFTLRSYVQALGGELELIVNIPGHCPLKIQLPDEKPGTAPKSGKPKPKVDQQKIMKAAALIREGFTVSNAAQQVGIGRGILSALYDSRKL